MNQEKFTLFQGDSREVIKQIPDNSIDSVVTDPPYGLNFMGKYWDTGEVAFDPKFWEEVLRVLKPGGHLLAFSGSRTYHRMACAIEDAGFEIRDQIMWLYGCLSEDSEILTKTGWKKGVDLDGSELVAQWDHETNEISFVVPERVIIKPYVGKMVHLRNRHTDQLLTPDHRVYAKIRRHSRDPEPSCYEVVPAGELKVHWYVDIPMSGNLNTGEEVDPDYAYLVGRFLTDAWAHGDGQNEHTFHVTGDIATKLINDWPERELDWRVLNWSAEARKRLLDGLIDGDGSRREHRHGHQFWSKNSHRLDIVSALYSMQGWRAYVNYKKGCVEANPKGKTQLQYKHRKNNPLVDYSGLVWCVTVPTGAFVARRNGKVFITGNSGFPKSLDVSKAIDKAAGAEREVVGKKFVTNAAQGKGLGHGELVGGKVRAGLIDITAPATEAAKQWQGWGTALKPSFEPLCVAYKPLDDKVKHESIVMARKPFKGTVAENVLEHGTGALNIDGCRVERSKDDVSGWSKTGNRASENMCMSGPNYARDPKPDADARWPANVIHDGSEEVMALFPTENGKSPSRFFYCPKASKTDRNDGLNSKTNNHPTVKPTKLMQYLCRLVTPPGGTILDPFTGSGSTGRGAILEGFRFVGIERDPEYIEIAESRIRAVSNNNSENNTDTVSPHIENNTDTVSLL